MTDLQYGASVVPSVTESGPSAATTPLQRAARSLQSALPVGWQVQVVDIARRPADMPQPVLRVLMPEN